MLKIWTIIFRTKTFRTRFWHSLDKIRRNFRQNKNQVKLTILHVLYQYFKWTNHSSEGHAVYFFPLFVYFFSSFVIFLYVILSYLTTGFIWYEMICHMKCRPTRVEKYVYRIPYFFKLCFPAYEFPFLYISGKFPSHTGRWGKISRNIKKRKLMYKKAQFWKIRYLLNIFFNPCRSTFHMTYHFISDETCDWTTGIFWDMLNCFWTECCSFYFAVTPSGSVNNAI